MLQSLAPHPPHKPAVARLSMCPSTIYALVHAHPETLERLEVDALETIERDVRCVERLLAASSALDLVLALLALALWLPYLVLMPVRTALRALVVVGEA
ncbi:hypothetical protein B0H17DRAFT_1332528 [Mycena rosella]|uniref:Uncharacterized protein n=1 Tax=Mycena rosella TaxID=1033263 RepID=A0AAD7GEF2_MYCRO|nr:hypothetical protein B0H17DRAFT_1332528 [Mycena rosella]